MKKLAAFIVCIFSFSFVFPVHASDIFKLGYSEYKPFIWEENNRARGIYVDVLTEALENRLGIPVSFTPYPLKRLVQNVKKGVVDGFVDVSTKERLAYCSSGSVPVAVGMVGAFTYRNHPRIEDLADVDTLEELKGYSILTYLGDDWISDYLDGFTIDAEASDLAGVFRKLQYRRGDIILQIEQVAQYNINELGLQNEIVQVPNIALNPVFYQLLVSKKSSYTSILRRLDTVITAMINDGTIDAIYNKYRGTVVPRKITSTKKTKIRFIHYATGIMPMIMNLLADSFNAGHDDIRLKTIHMDMERYKQAIKVMMAGGAPADIIMTWAGYRTQFLVDMGVIEAIDGFWEELGLDKVFPESTVKGMTYYGHKYAVPLTHHIVSIFYNKQIFSEHDISIPKTWDEFLSVCETLKSHNITPIALGTKHRWPAQSWFDYLLVRTAGPGYRQNLMAGQARFTDPQVQRVFGIWKDLIDRGFFNEDSNNLDYQDATKMVYEGKAAMTLNGTWIAGDFQKTLGWEPSVDFDFFTFPQIDQDIPDVIVGVLDVILQTQKGKAHGSSRALEFFAAEEAQMLISEYNGSVSPRKTVSQSLSPYKQKIAAVIEGTPFEVFSYDLSTPPRFAEIGLTAFKEFLADPESYMLLLEETEKRIQERY